MLSEESITEYLRALAPDQTKCIRSIRALISEYCPSLVEEVSSGKWYRGLLVYSFNDTQAIVYALGPLAGGKTTFHMMPYYASASLQETYGTMLKPLMSGKSCIKFTRYDQVPEEAIRAILGSSESYARALKEKARKHERS